MLFFRISCILLLFSCLSCNKGNSTSTSRNTGKFANGLRYHVERNSFEEKKAVLYLGVNVGSCHEENNERGYAHFLEHMLFRGTENFQDFEIINHLRSLGSEFGPDINAFTSYDRTVYMFEIPLSTSDSLQKTISMVAEMMSVATLDQGLIDKENTVILDEFRQRSNTPHGRVGVKSLEFLLKDSTFENKHPLGTEESILTTDSESLSSFYKKWYRPENMIVVVSGDVDIDSTTADLENAFGSLKNEGLTPDSAIHPTLPEKSHFGECEIFEEEELVGDYGCCFNYLTPICPDSDENIKQIVCEGLVQNLVTTRLERLAHTPETPIKSASLSVGTYFSGMSLSVLSVSYWEGRAKEGFNKVFSDLKFVLENGFSSEEIEVVMETFKASYETRIDNLDKRRNSQVAMENVVAFLENRNAINFEYYYQKSLDYLSTITNEDLKAALEKLTNSGNFHRAYLVCQNKEVNQVTSDEFFAFLDVIQSEELGSFKKEISDPKKVVDPSGKVLDITKYDSNSVMKVELSNGMKVYCLKSDLEKGVVRSFFSAQGGYDLFNEEDIASCFAATMYGGLAGFGGLDANAINNYLDLNNVSLSHRIGPTSRYISTRSLSKTLPSAMNLIHSIFTHKNSDPSMWELVINRIDESNKRSKIEPAKMFQKHFQDIAFCSHYIFKTYDSSCVSEAKTFEILNDLTSDPSEFLGYIVGDFDENQVLELLESTLAKIPSASPTERIPLVTSLDSPKEPVRDVFKGGSGDVSQTNIVFSVNPKFFEAGSDTQTFLKSMSTFSELLTNRLQDALRRNLGDSYSVYVYPTLFFYPSLSSAKMNITFSSSVERSDELIDATLKEIESLQIEKVPTETEISNSIELHKQQKRSALLSNLGKIQTLHNFVLLDLDLADMDEHFEFPEDNTLDGLELSFEEQAKYLFPLSDFVCVTKHPE